MMSIMNCKHTGRTFLRETQTPSVSEINKNFLIRFRASDDKVGWTKLISAGQYHKKFGEKYRDEHFTRAMESGEERITLKIRGRYEITFVAR